MHETTAIEHVKGVLSRFLSGKYFLGTALVVNVGFYFLVNLLVLIQETGYVLNDFYFTFMPGVDHFLADPGSLYDTPYHEYRNLPALVLYHMLFHGLGSTGKIDLFFCSLFIVYFNLASCWLIFKITRHQKIQAISTSTLLSSPCFIAGSYLIVSWHYFEYYHGHTQAITGFFVLLGMYFMLQDKEHLGFMSWSIATIFKLNPVLLITFLIWRRPFSRFIKNVVFSIIPQIPNIIMFLAWPKLLLDFIPSNIAFSLENAVVFYRVSGTFARELSYFFNLPITGFSIAMVTCFVPTTMFILYRRKLHLVDQIALVILATITILPDFWTAHALYVIIPYLIWISVKSPCLSLQVKLVCGIPLFLATPWFLLLQLNVLYSFSFPLISLCFFVPFVVMTINSIRRSCIDPTSR